MQFRFVRRQLGLEGAAALKGAIGQHALAETVDRVNRRRVKFRQRQPQAHLGGIGVQLTGVYFLQQRAHKLVRGLALFQRGQRLGEAALDAVAQFLGGSVGKRDSENLPRLQLALQQQPHEQAGDVVGLACACAGLNERHARVQRRGRQVKLFSSGAHFLSGMAASSKKGPNTRRAVSENSSPSSGSV